MCSATPTRRPSAKPFAITSASRPRAGARFIAERRSLERWCARLALRRGDHLETQHADHLPGLGDHSHPPAPFGGGREVELVRPGTITLLAPAADVQGNAIDFPTVVLPDVIDALVEAAWGIDRGVGVETVGMQALRRDLRQALAGRALF